MGYQSTFLGCFFNCYLFKTRLRQLEMYQQTKAVKILRLHLKIYDISVITSIHGNQLEMTNPMAQGQIMYIDENNQTQQQTLLKN